jgi:hypothetical protein
MDKVYIYKRGCRKLYKKQINNCTLHQILFACHNKRMVVLVGYASYMQDEK